MEELTSLVNPNLFLMILNLFLMSWRGEGFYWQNRNRDSF